MDFEGYVAGFDASSTFWSVTHFLLEMYDCCKLLLAFLPASVLVPLSAANALFGWTLGRAGVGESAAARTPPVRLLVWLVLR